VLIASGKKRVVAHPDIWAAKYSKPKDAPMRFAGIPYSREHLESLGAAFELTREPVWLAENVVTTGEVVMDTDYERVESNLYVRRGDDYLPDPLADDQALFVKTSAGLVAVLAAPTAASSIPCARDSRSRASRGFMP